MAANSWAAPESLPTTLQVRNRAPRGRTALRGDRPEPSILTANDPPAHGEDDPLADLHTAAGLVDPCLGAGPRQPHPAFIDEGGGQGPGLEEPRPPKPDIDPAGSIARETLRPRRRRGGGALAGVRPARAAKGEAGAAAGPAALCRRGSRRRHRAFSVLASPRAGANPRPRSSRTASAWSTSPERPPAPRPTVGKPPVCSVRKRRRGAQAPPPAR